MADCPDITIVVPAYNQGPFIERTLQSLLTQQIKPAEIVVSNNHSTDETIEILERYRSRVRLISPPKFIPAGEHGDFLVSHVRTTWCALLSSDDVAETNYVAAFADSIAQYPSAALVHGGVLYIDKDERTAVPRYALKARERASFPLNLIEQLGAPVVNFAGFAFRVDAFRRTSGFSPWLGMGDWPVFLQLAPHGDFIYRREILARYRCTYRPTLNLDRYVAFLHDEYEIATQLIPDLLKKHGQEHLATLHKKRSRERYYRRLAEFYSYGNEVDRSASLMKLTMWAKYLGESIPTDTEYPPWSLRVRTKVEFCRYHAKRVARSLYGQIKYLSASKRSNGPT